MVNRGHIGKLPGGERTKGALPLFPHSYNAPLISDMMKTVMQSCQLNTMCLTSTLSRRMNLLFTVQNLSA